MLEVYLAGGTIDPRSLLSHPPILRIDGHIHAHAHFNSIVFLSMGPFSPLSGMLLRIILIP